MIIYNDKEYRNLVEQVEENKQKIAQHYEIDRVLANFGIRIVGVVAEFEDLPDPLTYTGDYGDAYGVGTEGNYTYWIFTRPDINSGQPENYWLDVGKLGLQGPAGPAGAEGPEGPKGERGSVWYIGNTVPSNAELNEHDMWLNSFNGNVYEWNGSAWIIRTNLTGPQGAQGPQGPQGIQGPVGPQGIQGEKGDVGGFINIFGRVNIPEQLPTPSALDNLTAAYLVGTQSPYDLYIQIGENSNVATWNNAGPFNAATLVMVQGAAQNVWDADTKLDKNTSVSTYSQAYIKAPNGVQTTMNVTKQVATDVIVQRQNTGNITVPLTPTNNNEATSKYYVDTNTVAKITSSSVFPRAYVIQDSGDQGVMAIVKEIAQPSSIALRNESGNIKVPVEPEQDNDAVAKSWVDNNFMKPANAHVEFPGREEVKTWQNLTINNSWFSVANASSDTTSPGPTFTQFYIWYNPTLRLMYWKGRITINSTSTWTGRPQLNISDDLFVALGATKEDGSLYVPIAQLPIPAYQAGAKSQLQGGYMSCYGNGSNYIALLQTDPGGNIDATKTAGQVRFHLNMLIPY